MHSVKLLCAKTSFNVVIKLGRKFLTGVATPPQVEPFFIAFQNRIPPERRIMNASTLKNIKKLISSQWGNMLVYEKTILSPTEGVIPRKPAIGSFKFKARLKINMGIASKKGIYGGSLTHFPMKRGNE